MARLARVVVPGCPHHVTQRGNRRMQTFFCEDDYGAYLAEGDWLAERIAGWTGTWRAHVLEPDEADLAIAMRQRENTGRPLGDQAFVKKLEALLGRKLLPGNPGRPKKARK